jgi:hypothetical protein
MTKGDLIVRTQKSEAGVRQQTRAAALAVAATFVLAGAAAATHVEPVLVDPWQSGNAATECAAAGTYQYAYKVDNWDDVDENGTYQADFGAHQNAITISNSDGTYFDWSASSPIGAVIVKAGTGANVFYYEPQESSDTGLYGPANDKGNPREVSHVTFCWNPEEVEYAYETAFGYNEDPNGICFLDLGFGRWGWTNPVGPGSYNFELWAAAGQCDFDKGIEVGSVGVEYTGSTVIATVNLSAGFVLGETHVYAGTGQTPVTSKGVPTVAPGQYRIEGPFSGEEIYVIVHAVVGIPVTP